MSLNKLDLGGKKAIVIIVLLLAALVCATFFFGGDADKQTPVNKPEQENSEQIESSDSHLASDLPDVNPEDYNYEQIFPSTFDEDPPSTTLTKEQIEEGIANFLPRLLALEPGVVDQVSARTYSGTYNPLRYMLEAVEENQDMLDAFRNMAQYTEYEILGYAGDPKEGNSYSVYLTVTTPYMTLTAEEMAAGADQTEKYTPFQSTGAAKKSASMNLEQVERGTDFICLRFIIEDDVPVLYSCTSYFFESDATVQYAFFWGGIKFYGTRGGDLLLNNAIGGAKEATRSSAMSKDMDQILELAKEGDLDALIERGAFRQKIKEDMYKVGFDLPDDFDIAELRQQYMDTVQYTPKFYCDENGDGAFALVWSFEDPYLGKKVIQHDFLNAFGYWEEPSIIKETSYALFSYYLEESYGGSSIDLGQRVALLNALAEDTPEEN